MNDILVSVIIPTHNRKVLLRKAINSVISQTYKKIECIVVDDGSGDGTESYISDLIEERRVIFIRTGLEKSKGASYTRNVGIKASQGQYIAFLDDDDIWLPTKIEKQVKLAMSSRAGLVYCGRIFETDFNREGRVRERIKDTGKFPEGNISHEAVVRAITVSSTLLVKRQLLEEVGMFDEDLRVWEDYELAMRVLQHTKAAVVREDLVIYRNITKDHAKLSNNFLDVWEIDVRQVDNKNRDLIEKLSQIDRDRHRLYEYITLFNCARKNGIVLKQMKYVMKVIFEPRVLRIAIIKCFTSNKRQY